MQRRESDALRDIDEACSLALEFMLYEWSVVEAPKKIVEERKFESFKYPVATLVSEIYPDSILGKPT